MSNGKLFQSFGAATLKARKVEDNFVRGTTTKFSSAYRKDLVGLSPSPANSDADGHQNRELNVSSATLKPTR